MVIPISIPKQEQLEALASGLREVYELLEKYLGDIRKVPNYWNYINVNKAELADYLRSNSELISSHIYKSGDPIYHDFPVLQKKGNSYCVCVYLHGNLHSEACFDDLAEAAADYLMYFKC
jgi:hypothetical protein